MLKRLNRAADAAEMVTELRHLCGPDQQQSLDNVLFDLYQASRDWAGAIALQERELAQNDTEVAEASQLVVSGFTPTATREEIVAIFKRLGLVAATYVCTVVASPDGSGASAGIECDATQAKVRVLRTLGSSSARPLEERRPPAYEERRRAPDGHALFAA